VRFRDSGNVYRAVLAALREKLLATDLTPGVRTALADEARLTQLGTATVLAGSTQ